MQDNPCDDYKYIGHVMCQNSKFHVLWPMKTKRDTELRECLRRHVLSYFGLPKIFQFDHDLAFQNKEVEELIKNWKGQCQIVYDRLTDPQLKGNSF